MTDLAEVDQAPSSKRRRRSPASDGGSFRTRLDEKGSPWLYIAPFFIIFLIFGIFPIIYTSWVSFHDWNPLTGHSWVGLDNYTRLLTEDPRFWNAAQNTLSIWVISTIPQLAGAIMIAHLLNQAMLRFSTGFRMGVLVPQITSVLAVAIIFNSIFGRDYGLLNWIITSLGFERIDWQAGTLSSHVAISSMVMWRWTGYNALIYLAAMQAIPRDLYESASIDGANEWKKFTRITIPQLRSTIIFTVIVSTIGGMQIFAEPLIFSGQGNVTGGSARQFQTLVLFLYEQGFRRFEFGYASAIAWLLFIMIMIFALINFFLSRRISQS